jgi:hypothetical protein
MAGTDRRPRTSAPLLLSRKAAAAWTCHMTGSATSQKRSAEATGRCCRFEELCRWSPPAPGFTRKRGFRSTPGLARQLRGRRVRLERQLGRILHGPAPAAQRVAANQRQRSVGGDPIAGAQLADRPRCARRRRSLPGADHLTTARPYRPATRVQCSAPNPARQSEDPADAIRGLSGGCPVRAPCTTSASKSGLTALSRSPCRFWSKNGSPVDRRSLSRWPAASA